LGLWLAGSVLRSHPHYLAYFNEAAGGPAGGYRALVDSNIDWGQGLKPLAETLAAMGNPPVILSYFGVADPGYYKLRFIPLGAITNVADRPATVGVQDWRRALFAVSATNLQGTYFVDHGIFSWLKTFRPLAVPGHSIFLYDLTEEPAARERLAVLAAGIGRLDLAAQLREAHAKAD
jgi:hypothetical protein